MKKYIFDNSESLVKIAPTVSGANKSNYRIILAIDTGSYHSILKPEIIEEIGGEILAGGYKLIPATESFHADTSSLKKISVLGITKTELQIAVSPLPPDFEIDGLLGNSFFRDHKISFDFPNGTISIE